MSKLYWYNLILIYYACSISYGQTINNITSLTDTGRVYGFQSIQKTSSAGWKKIQSPNFGKDQNIGWVKFHLYSPKDQEIWLEAQSHFIDTLSLLVNEINSEKKSKAVLYQQQTRNSWKQPFPHRYFLYAIPLKATSNYTFYMRGSILSPECLKFPLVIWAPHKFYRYLQSQTWSWGIFLGFMLIAILVSLISFGFHPQSIFIYYVGYILFTSIYALLNDGWGRYLPGALSVLDDSVTIGHWLNLGLLFLILFSRKFLNVKEGAEQQKWWLKFNPIWLALFVGFNIYIIYFAKAINQFSLYYWFYQVGFFAGLGYLILWIFYVLDAFQRNFRPVWLHILSIAVMLLFYFINIVFINTGILKIDFPDMPVFRIALATDVFFIAISLIYRNWLYEKTQKHLQIETSTQQQALYEAQQKIQQDEIKSLRLQNELQLQRERLARDLHDGIGSQLTHIASKLDMLAIRSVQTRELEALSNFTRETNQILRETIWVLNHNHIEYIQLQKRISSFLNRVLEEREQLELKISMTHNSTLLISPVVALAIFRIIQEVINNAFKYAGADCIEILFRQKNETVIVEMGDNGRGFDMHTIKKGYGLENIQKRCSELSGKSTLCSIPENGTVIIIELPAS